MITFGIPLAFMKGIKNENGGKKSLHGIVRVYTDLHHNGHSKMIFAVSYV